jgi:hypothetical protein
MILGQNDPEPPHANLLVRTTEAYLLVHFEAKLCLPLIKRGANYTLKMRLAFCLVCRPRCCAVYRQ